MAFPAKFWVRILSLLLSFVASNAWADDPFILPYVRHVITGNNGDPVVYYITKPEKPSPLVVIVDNDICFSAFDPDGTGHYFDHEGILTSWHERPQFTYMVVEHPYVQPSKDHTDAGRTSHRHCPRDYLERADFEYFVNEVVQAIVDSRHLPQVKPGELMVMGEGFGGITALLAAQQMDAVTHVAVNNNLANTGLWLYVNNELTMDRAGDETTRKAVVFFDDLMSKIPDDASETDRFIGDVTPHFLASFRRNARVEMIKNSKVHYFLDDFSSLNSKNDAIITLSMYLDYMGFNWKMFLHNTPKPESNAPDIMEHLLKDYMVPLDWFQCEIQTGRGVQQ